MRFFISLIAWVCLCLSTSTAFRRNAPLRAMQRSGLQANPLAPLFLANNELPTSSFDQQKSLGYKLRQGLSLVTLLGWVAVRPSQADENSSVGLKGGKIVVLGAGGRTGKLIVQGLKSQGANVIPVLRNSDSSASTVVVADVTNKASLLEVLKDAEVVVFAASASKKGGNAEAVDYLGVKNVGEVCLEQHVPHYIVISSGAVTKPDSLGFKVTNLFGNIMNLKRKGEVAVEDMYSNYYAASDEPKKPSYVIVRPGGLSDGPAAGPSNVELNQGDTIIGEVSRQDVADCVAAMASYLTSNMRKQDALQNVIFEIYGKKSAYPLQANFKKPSGMEVSGNSFEDMFPLLKSGITGVEETKSK